MLRLRESSIASAIAAFETAWISCAGGGFLALCSSIIFFVSSLSPEIFAFPLILICAMGGVKLTVNTNGASNVPSER